jgi:predicted GIY-YIG superfamily endonuclease
VKRRRANDQRANGYGSARQMKFFYVYILQSKSNPKNFYTGFTEDLQGRLKTHNSGQVTHTSKHIPWQIKTAVAFTERKRAVEFERYLKTASGRAFAKKRL